jgi:hypothetical protein
MKSGKVHRNYIKLAFAVVVFCITPMAADGAFEDVELGARPLGMGSAFVATADDASAIFWNSAGLTRVDGRELTMSYMELYDLVSYSSVGYAHSLRVGKIGAGLVSSSDIDGAYRETILALSAAGKIYRGLSLGSNVKYLSSSASTGNIRVGSGRGVSLDAGCQYSIKEDLVSLGIVFQNLVGYVSYNREAVRDIPGQKYSQRPGFSYKAGAGIDLGSLLPHIDKTVLAAQLSDGDIHTGLECIFWNVAAIRAGFRTGNALTRSITTGLGIKLAAIRLDYAYVGSQIGSQTSQFSVSVNW